MVTQKQDGGKEIDHPEFQQDPFKIHINKDSKNTKINNIKPSNIKSRKTENMKMKTPASNLNLNIKNQNNNKFLNHPHQDK